MKKILLMLPLVFAATMMSSFASETNADPQALATFNKQFAGAENVSWHAERDGMHRASFTWAGYRSEAYFSATGEFLGAARGLSYQQLPLAVIRGINKRFSNASVLELREISNELGTSYSILLEHASRRVQVKMNVDGGVEEVERIKK